MYGKKVLRVYSTKEEFHKSESFASVVKRLGNPESTTLIHSSCHVFRIPQVDGVVGYHQIGNCAVVIGDPICLSHDTPKLTNAFHFHCQKRGLSTVYLTVHHDFAHWAIHNGCQTLIQIGSELSINPTHFRLKHKLRNQMNQSLKHAVQVKEYTHFDPLLESQMKNTLEIWSKQRRGVQIHLGNNNYFYNDIKKRIFYAQQKDTIIGFLVLTPLDRFQGWVVNTHLAILEAPAGTKEHLMCTVFNSLAQEKCHFLCLGAISGTQLGEVIGLNSFDKTLASLIFKVAKWFFKLDAKATHLKKYRPNLQPTFLVCSGKLTIIELLAIKNALNVKVW